MKRRWMLLVPVLLLGSGCALRSQHVAALPADTAQFRHWDCEQLHAESDRAQREAARVAYSFDERAGNNVVALGLGVTVFWPALLAMRPTGMDAQALAALKGRHEALQRVAGERGCAPLSATAGGPQRALPVALGERLVYEQRSGPRASPQQLTLTVRALHRQGIELTSTGAPGLAAAPEHPVPAWRHDFDGNLLAAPFGPTWPQLIRQELSLGQLVHGEIVDARDAAQHARVRGQVVALGPQRVAQRQFDAAVLELFGDATTGENWARLDGVLVVDRHSGVLLRLDLFGPAPAFALTRRLMRIDEPQP